MNKREEIACRLAARDGWYWDDMPPYREGYLAIADAALDALKEPTEGMLNRGVDVVGRTPDETREIWQVMVRAAKDGK